MARFSWSILALFFVGSLAGCPDGWTGDLIPDTCYLAGNAKSTFQNAVEFCRNVGAFLAEPKTLMENLAIGSFHSGVGNIWIGISDFDRDRNFTYNSDGEALTFEFFSAGQPNNVNGNQDCVEIWRTCDRSWNDEWCGNLRNFVCQRKANQCNCN